MGEDIVNHPDHYTMGNFEVIEIIKDQLPVEGFLGYLRGNLIKYILRYKHKGGIEDLKKAHVYLGWLIDAEEERSIEGE